MRLNVQEFGTLGPEKLLNAVSRAYRVVSVGACKTRVLKEMWPVEGLSHEGPEDTKDSTRDRGYS